MWQLLIKTDGRYYTASSNGQADVVKLLLEKGAEIGIKSNDN